MSRAIPLLFVICLIVAACGGAPASSTEPSAEAEPSRAVAPSAAPTEVATPEPTDEATAEPSEEATAEPEPATPEEAVAAAIGDDWNEFGPGVVADGTGIRFGGCDTIDITDDETGAFGYLGSRSPASPTGPTDVMRLRIIVVPVVPAGIMDVVAADAATCRAFDYPGVATGTNAAAPATVGGLQGYLYRQTAVYVSSPPHADWPWFIGPIGDDYMLYASVGLRSEQEGATDDPLETLDAVVESIVEALDR